MFAILLLYLFKCEISFESIVGRLSVSDAENENWLTSIPYYAKFEQFVPASVGYRLKFYLYDDKEAMYAGNHMDLPDYKEKDLFREFLYGFQREHIMQGKDAYFRYTVETMNLEKR